MGVIAEIDGELFADISDTVEFAKMILSQVVKGYCLDAIVSRSKKETPLDEDRVVNSLEDFREGRMIVGDSPNKVGKDIRIKTEKSLSNIFSYRDQIVHWVIVKA